MKTISSPSGGAYLTIRSSNPDPSRRFAVTVSDNYLVGVQGLRDLAASIVEFCDEIEPPAKPKASPRKAKAKD